MKQFRITFTEQEMAQFEQLIGETPTKFGNPLINMYVPKLETLEEDPKPIGGGGGGGAPKPKPNA
jgi:hypothetical protein